jgi:hypothetical protein
MEMKDREVIDLKFEADHYWGLPCTCCDGESSVVGKGVDELGHSVFVCARCLKDPEQIDAKLEQQAAELEKHAADLIKKAACLRNFKGRIKAPSFAEWVAAKRKYQEEFEIREFGQTYEEFERMAERKALEAEIVEAAE